MSPNRVYKAKHEPPRLDDRIKIHWMEVVITVSAVFVCVVMVTARFAGLDLFLPVEETSPPLFFAVSIFMAVGAVLATVGTLWSGKNVSKGWRVEIIGWGLLSGGWLAASASIWIGLPNAVLIYGVVALIGFGALGKMILVFTDGRSTARKTRPIKEIREAANGTRSKE